MNDIKDELERIAGTAAPAPQVDIAAAAARGRRVQRARRAAVAVTAAGAVAAAAVFVPPQDSGRGGVASPSSAHPAPLVARASFGWLPDGFRQTRMAQLDHGQRFFSMAATGADGRQGIQLFVHRRGSEPRMIAPLGKEVARTLAAPVNGRPAHWTIKPGDPPVAGVAADFRWEYKKGHWAQLRIDDPRLAKAETVRRIAAATLFADHQVAFPLRVEGIPAGFKVYHAVMGAGPLVRLHLRAPNAPEGDDLSIAMLPFREDIPVVKPRNTPTMATYQGIVRGYRISFTAEGDALRRVNGEAGLRRLFERTTLFPDIPGKWTPRPLG